jgi:hypothetical protein
LANPDGVFQRIERRTGILFLAAGALFLIWAGMQGVEAFMNRSAPVDVFGPAGFAVAFVGLLGLYPSLADRSKRLVQVGAAFAVLGFVFAAATSLWHLGLWVFPAVVPAYASALAGGMLLGQFLGYTPFGVASLRTELHSRTVGLLLVAVPVLLVALLVTLATGYASPVTAVVFDIVTALLHLAIGVTLRTT